MFLGLILAILTLHYGTILALEARPVPGRFGPEFTFTSDAGNQDPYLEYFYQHSLKHLIANQPPGAEFTNKGHTFFSPNGWSFSFLLDPGVLEFRVSPMTVSEIRRFKSDIQDAIFVSAYNIGLVPWDYRGGGHINFDMGIFEGDVLLARNFVVDFWNHSELSMGCLNYDTNNAVPFPLLSPESQTKVRLVLLKAEKGEFGDGLSAVKAFFQELNQTLNNARSPVKALAIHKHHDLAFHFDDNRVEIRSVRPQANMDVWLHQTELIEGRIHEHLRSIRHPIKLEPRVSISQGLAFPENIPTSPRYVPPIAPQRALEAFYVYVAESGLDWNDHRDYIWPPWRQNGELEKFEASKKFKELKFKWKRRHILRTLRGCEHLLAQ